MESSWIQIRRNALSYSEMGAERVNGGNGCPLIALQVEGIEDPGGRNGGKELFVWKACRASGILHGTAPVFDRTHSPIARHVRGRSCVLGAGHASTDGRKPEGMAAES